MEKFQVNVGGIPELQNLVLDHAEKLGYIISGRSMFIHPQNKYLQLNAFKDMAVTYSVSEPFKPEEVKEISIIEFLKMKKKKVVIFNLNNQYDAVITEDGIKVGCQTFSFNKFDELVKAVKDFRTSQ